ncbi:hypothetical protein BJV78DRAFT_1280248 [Lactifluus subvellereus]|nr:hypothetical protein BJV78DRAFT_1280248 [Lactifluus subvellereus]
MADAATTAQPAARTVDSITNLKPQERHARPLQRDSPSPLRTPPQPVQDRDAASRYRIPARSLS